MMLSTTETTVVKGRNSTAPSLRSSTSTCRTHSSDSLTVKVRNMLCCALICSAAATPSMS